MTKYYAPGLVSVVAVLAYFSPWYIEVRTGAVFYVLAYLWFLVAWIPMVVQLILAIKQRQSNQSSSQHHLSSAVLTVISYAVTLTGQYNGYILTV